MNAVSTHASVRRRRALTALLKPSKGFNSRLREEATGNIALHGQGSVGFNSRLREEATFPCALIAARALCFNSRLREEAT